MTVTANIERCDEVAVCGWAVDPTAPDRRVQIDVLLGRTLIGSCVADAYRADLAAAGLGDGHCAFQFSMPTFQKWQVKDVIKYLTVRVAGSDEVLVQGNTDAPTSWQTFSGGLIDRPDLKAEVERCDEMEVAGWAFDPTSPDRRISIEVLWGQTLIGSCVADGYRSDLAAAGFGDGHCAFKFSMPTFPRGQVKFLTVRVAGNGEVLARGDTGSTVVAPSFSRFGGMWIDRPDFKVELERKKRGNEVSSAVAAQIECLARDGYVILENAVPVQLIDDLNAEIEAFWHNPPKGLMIETFEPDGQFKIIPARLDFRPRSKLRDLYAFSALAREATMSPAVTALLAAVFDAKPKAFQSLYFWRGSEQRIHKDTAYVKIDSEPMHLLASWLALEDIRPRTGELEYFAGSHRAPDFLFGGMHKWMEANSAEHDAFLASLQEDARTFGQDRRSFLAKKGDVLIWHADLAHGGSAVDNAEATRKSLVTHFTSERDEPFFRRHSAFQELKNDRCVFVSEHVDVTG
jgi:phytanoyl-CoA dioxygenase PhyH